MDPNLFYPKPPTMLAKGPGKPPRGESISPEAVAACERCPFDIKEKCAEWAVAHEGSGYWGGMTERERAMMRNAESIVLWEPQSSITYIGGGHGVAGESRMKFSQVPHGTPGGYKMERRRGMEPCDACRAAHTGQTREVKNAQREKLSA